MISFKEKKPIKNMISFGSDNADIFCLDYRLTSKCNYDCWYCKDLHDNKFSNGIFNLDKIKNFINVLNRDIRFFIYGGEPTLHPNFNDLICGVLPILSSKSVLEIQTNLSLSESKLKKVCNEIYVIKKNVNASIKFLVSYHHNECDLNNFIRKCSILYDLSLLDQVAVMFQNKHRDDILTIFKIFRSLFKNTKVELLPTLCGSVSEDDENPYIDIDLFYNCPEALDLSKDSYSFLKRLKITNDNGIISYTSSADLWKNRQNSFKGMLCDVGKERIVINSDGKCYRCFNQIFDKDYSSEYNIFSEKDPSEFIENMKSLKCPYDKCFFDFNHKRVKI